MRFILYLLCLLCLASPALAHKVNVFAYVEQGKILGEAYFGASGKAMNSPIEIYDAKGNLLAKTQTGADGGFSLPVPQGEPPFRVVLKAGEGHQNDYTLQADELGLSQAQPDKPAQAGPQALPASGKALAAPDKALDGPQNCQEIEARLAGLDERLKALNLRLERLAARESEVSYRDVIGGLGWIAGLFGAAMFAGSRKKAG